MTIARSLAFVAAGLAASACGDDAPDARERRARDKLAALEREREKIALDLEAMQFDDGKHWYDLPPPGALGYGLHDCERYMVVARAFATCSEVPAATRDALTRSLDSMTQAWRTTDPSARDAANDGCRQGISAMRAGGNAIGCALPDPP